MLLDRGGLRTTLSCRTEEQARELASSRENKAYLPGVPIPHRVVIRALGVRDDQPRADLILLAVPSQGLGEAIEELTRRGISPRA